MRKPVSQVFVEQRVLASMWAHVSSEGRRQAGSVREHGAPLHPVEHRQLQGASLGSRTSRVARVPAPGRTTEAGASRLSRMRTGTAKATASRSRSHEPVTTPDPLRANSANVMSQNKASDLTEYRMEDCPCDPTRRDVQNWTACIP